MERKAAAHRKIKQFKKEIRKYYRAHRRDFPWRPPILKLRRGIAANPYQVLVSEIMLQQTQTQRVEVKYPLFLRRFPNFARLANASAMDVLREWQGMGYNRRALYVQRIAKIVIEKYHGTLPRDPLVLQTLPGIGEGTAGAIAVFAFNQAVPFIETNIRRAYIHFFFPRKKNVQDEEILKLVKKTLDYKNPREWYYALMDYGAMLGGLKKNPNHRSKIYKKQTPFKGSLREVRGRIIKELASGKTLQKKNLEILFPDRKASIPAVIEGLKRERFIREKRGVLSLV